MSGRNGLRVRGVETGWESRGGYMEAKLQKLEQQFREDSDGQRQLSSIFYGVSIYVNGYTNPTADELKITMSKHGGKFHQYYSRSKTSHVIASTLPHAKRKELRPDQKVVKPQWVVDCLKAQQLLPIEKYLVVPLDNGTQNRITSLLGKRRSAESDSKTVTETIVNSETGNDAGDLSDLSPLNEENKKKALSSGTSKLSNRTICPTTDSNFLSEFYSHSRLHFLSTWKMELIEYVRSLQSKESMEKLPLSGFQKLIDLSSKKKSNEHHGRSVMHIDMDCFFVSIGLVSRPELRGLPVAVTHSAGSAGTRERPGTDLEYEKQYYESKFHNKANSSNNEIAAATGESSSNQHKSLSYGPGFSSSEIASCSYEARAAGVKNGMFLGKAKQLCPELELIPYDFEAYRAASDKLYSTVATYTRNIEAVSCDELLVDITQLVKTTGLAPIQVVSYIRQSVKEATCCNASAGVGPNISLARMATRRAKPDGEYAVEMAGAKEFMQNVPVRELPGVGRSTAFRLQEMGLSTCGDLQRCSIESLKMEFGGKTGQKLHDMSCGIDNREICNEKERKSVSAEVNYGIRLSNDDEARAFLQNLSQEVTNRLKSIGMRGRRVTLKAMIRKANAPMESSKYGGHGICDSLSRSSQITLKCTKGSVYETDAVAIFEAVWSMLESLKVNVADLRGIGIQITQLVPADSLSTSKESSSAAFMQKFIVKKVENQADNITHKTTQKVNESNLKAPSTVNNVSALGDQDESAPQGDALNTSFLDALPPELRKEVQENFKQQRQALERNFQNNESSNFTARQLASELQDPPSAGTNANNVLFCGQGRLLSGATSNSATSGSKVTKGRGRGSKGPSTRSKSQKLSAVSKTSNQKSPNVGMSPIKLITDMFPVTYSPKKIEAEKKLQLKKSVSPSTSVSYRNVVSAAAIDRVKKKLVSIKEEVVEITDSEQEDPPDDAGNQPDEDATVEKQSEESTPSLGGAVTIQHLRKAIGEWTQAYAEEGPLECDVDDFISFLVTTATELRDLEKVLLVLKSFRRRLLLIRKENFFSTCDNWLDVYNRVCEEVQASVRKAYNGGELLLLPLNLY